MLHIILKMDKRCLDSLLKAKALSSDLKLFFVDNHSSDQTVELLTAYKKKYDFSRLRLFSRNRIRVLEMLIIWEHPLERMKLFAF